MLSSPRWTVHFVSRDLPTPTTTRSFLDVRPSDLVSWLDEAGLPDGLPFLLSPRFEYDVELNSYFLQANLTAPWNSNANRARALARFFTFLHTARGEKSWRAATEADHLAFHQWRRRDEAGPQVEGSTWNHEVSLVNQFYEWAGSTWPQPARRTWTSGSPLMPHVEGRSEPSSDGSRPDDSTARWPSRQSEPVSQPSSSPKLR
jgi:hypothetical protein